MNPFFCLADHEEPGPHLPLTAMTKTSTDAPAVPPSPVSVAKAAKETPIKPAECPAKCGECEPR